LHRGCAPLRQLAGLLRDFAAARKMASPVAEAVGEYK
jgi:hypothetical protein